jgi:hypothetical protein
VIEIMCGLFILNLGGASDYLFFTDSDINNTFQLLPPNTCVEQA